MFRSSLQKMNTKSDRTLQGVLSKHALTAASNVL
jgi:hypothetical protein